MSIDRLEEVVNDVSDLDGSWWPFLWLRPEKDASLSLGRVVWLSVLYGVPASVVTGIVISTLTAMSLQDLMLTVFSFPLVFLFTGSVIVAPMWNRRANRLRARIASRASD